MNFVKMTNKLKFSERICPIFHKKIFCIMIRSPLTVTANVLLIVNYIAVRDNRNSDMGPCLGTGYVLGGVFDKTFIR